MTCYSKLFYLNEARFEYSTRFDLDMKVKKTLIQTTVVCRLTSTRMQLLFSFDQDTRAEKTFIQTRAFQVSSTLMQIFSFDQDIRV